MHQQFEFWTGLLVGLFGVGATYMTTGYPYLGLGLTLLGLMFLLHYFWSEIRRLRLMLAPNDSEGMYVMPSREFVFSLIFAPVILISTVYVFYSSYPSTPTVPVGPLITGPFVAQDHPVNSPNFTGDYSHNEYNVNPDVNPNAPATRYFFNGERWTTNPAVAIGGNLEKETPQKQAFRAMAKLEDAQNWSALKERCEAETKKTPEWLTPPLLCGKVYAVQGEIDKAIELVEYVQKEAAGREDYTVADRLRELIRQQSGK